MLVTATLATLTLINAGIATRQRVRSSTRLMAFLTMFFSALAALVGVPTEGLVVAVASTLLSGGWVCWIEFRPTDDRSMYRGDPPVDTSLDYRA